ncbi:DUF3883 domain-containing protein [Metamycoplasma hyosynoviae]|uniref:protein NO VEIN domain-containing protein n=2 Tax=Metamycoplasma hyosynoviae TaxID=29559 RepID=UPI0023603FCA|nr:DUF3883 domain-containing protein [Metamycoplasma hyosynoviae]MDD1360741.1 DUF3883 domain-containing protein [Metamycoplasma hyosynoviae]
MVKDNTELKIRQEIIDEFLKKYDEWYSNNKINIEKYLKKCNELHNKFLEKFSHEKIEKLQIDDYVIGKRKENESFCYWVEGKLSKLGDIRGGRLTASSRFGLYYSADKSDYLFGGKKTKKTKFGSNKDEIFANIIQEIIKLLNDLNNIRNNNYDKLVKNKLNPLFKNKLIYLYDRENWLPIYSDSHLDIILSKLELKISNNSKTDRIYKRIELFNFFELLKSKRPDIAITPLSFMLFIYNDENYGRYIRGNKFVKLSDEFIKNKYTIEEVTSYEEKFIKSEKHRCGEYKKSNKTLEECKLTGNKGEEKVEDYLEQNRKELEIVGEIVRKAGKDDSAGYDFSYTRKDGTTIYIEVKATKSNNKTISFEMSSSEFDFMKRHKDCYFIMYINNVFKDNNIKKIPANIVRKNSKPSKFRIEFKQKNKMFK